jgi:hypothetical protein
MRSTGVSNGCGPVPGSDRLVHYAEILSLKGDSYRLKDRDLARPPAMKAAEKA